MVKKKVVAYASRCLSKSERKYCVTRKELLAVIHFIKYFRHYLYGRKFIIRTDHSSLKWLLRFKDPEGQLARWLEVVSSYEMEIQHRPGRQHINADTLSRKPCVQCGFHEGWDKKDESPAVKTLRTVYLKGEDSETIDLLEKQDNDRDIAMVK